jgi:hypothetical protein
MYPVELPPWLPNDVVLQMIERFQQHLISELLTMVKDVSGNSNSMAAATADKSDSPEFTKGHKPSVSINSINTDSSGSTDGWQTLRTRF